jgi:phosphinothricin acetyltransferase
VIVRAATEADLPAISAIYNHYVLTSTATYQFEPETLEDRRRWFETHGERHPVIVAEVDGEVVGWGSLSPFRDRDGYLHSTEASVYIRHDRHRKGLGRLILGELVERARGLGYHTIIGGASADQTASIALQESLGFQRVAVLREVGFKFGRWLDVVFTQLML